jgi:hypothetical protein
MKLLVSALLLLVGVAGAAQAGEGTPQGPCTAGFLPKGRAPEAVYLCTGPTLACRKNWFVGGADTRTDRIISYTCKPDMTRMSAMVGITPALCSDRFLPHPPGVSNEEQYQCETVDPRYDTQCTPGYSPGGLMLGEKPLAHAGSEAAATRRQLDGASITYVCVKQ